MNNHQSFQERLAIYDHLTATEQAQVDDHLRTCPECARALVAYRTMDQELQQMRQQKLDYLNREPAPLEQRLAATQPTRKPTQHAPWRIGMNQRSPLPVLQMVGVGAIALFLVWLAALLIGRNPLDTPVTAATPTTIEPIATAIVTPTMPSPVVANPDKRAVVRFVTYGWAKTKYEPLVAAFEQANPDVNIEMTSFEELSGVEWYKWPPSTFEKMLTAADVVDLFISPRQVSAGLVQDLTPFIAADPTFATDDFYPIILDGYRWNGGTWGLPTFIDFTLLYYDKDLFDAAGLAYPQPGWSWAEFVQMAQALTQRNGDDVTVWGFVNKWGSHLEAIESQTDLLFDGSATGSVPRLQEAAVAAAVERYADLFLQSQTSPFFKPPAAGQESGFTPEAKLIDLGQAAMWTDLATNWLWRNTQRRVGIVPYPTNANQQNTTAIIGQGRTMSALAVHPQAAWRWLNFLSHQSSGSYLQADSFPLRPSLAEANGFWQKMDAQAASVMRYALAHSYAAPADRSPVLMQAVSDALVTILSGEATVATALANVPSAVATLTQAEAATTAAPTPAPIADSPAVSPTTTITYMTVYAGVDVATLRTLAQQFQQRQPTIKVVVEPPPFLDAFDLPDVAAVADCFDWSPIVYASAMRETLVNLAPYLAAAPNLDRNDFYPGLLAQFTMPDGVWGLPSLAQPKVIEYNKALFDKLGLAYPSPTWTTDEFATLAKALTQGTGQAKQYGFVGDYYELSDAELFVARRGGTLYDRTTNPPSFAFTQPTTVAAMQWYADLTHEQGVKPFFATSLDRPNQGGLDFDHRMALISAGRAGMWSAIAELQPFTYSPPDRLITGIVPLPIGIDGKPAADPMAMVGYYISATSPHPQACWDWLHFLSEQPIGVQGIPARRSVVESAAYRQQVGDERATIYAALLDNYTPPADDLLLFQQPWLAKARPWWEAAYTKIVKGEAGAAEALQAAQQQAEAYRACVIAANAFQDETQQQICATSVGLPGQ